MTTVDSTRAQIRLIIMEWMGRNDCTSFIQPDDQPTNLGVPLDPEEPYQAERRMRAAQVMPLRCFVEGLMPVDELIDDLVKHLMTMTPADIAKVIK